MKCRKSNLHTTILIQYNITSEATLNSSKLNFKILSILHFALRNKHFIKIRHEAQRKNRTKNEYVPSGVKDT